MGFIATLSPVTLLHSFSSLWSFHFFPAPCSASPALRCFSGPRTKGAYRLPQVPWLVAETQRCPVLREGQCVFVHLGTHVAACGLGPSPYKSMFSHSSLLPAGEHVPSVSTEDHRHQDGVSEPELRRGAGTVLWAVPAESLRGGRAVSTAGPGRSDVGTCIVLAKGSLQVGIPGPFVGDQ